MTRESSNMHIADGFLEAPVIATTAVISASLVTVVAKNVPQKELTSPLVGASAAFVLAAKMINFPVASSVSGHIVRFNWKAIPQRMTRRTLRIPRSGT